MATRVATEKKLLALIDIFTPEIRKAFLGSISDVTSTTVLQSVVDAIEAGDIEQAFRSLGYSQAAMRPVTQMIERAFETGGVTVAGSAFPKRVSAPGGGTTVFRFDVRNSRAEAWLRDHSSDFVSRIGEETRTVIRDTVTAGVEAGRNPRNIALDIIGRVDPATGRRVGGVVGLTQQQAAAVRRVREELASGERDQMMNYFNRVRRDKRFDRTVMKAINDGRPVDADTLGKIANRYSDSLLQLRGENIARTEALQSLNQSADMAMRQAIDEGLINNGDVTKEWDASGDKRVRPTHAAMDGQRKGMDEPFTSPSGAQLMFPGDSSLGAGAEEVINCRCIVKHDVDFLGAAVRAENGNPTPPPLPTPIPVPPDIPALNATAKAEVVSKGKLTKTEHLRGIDEVTGEILQGLEGQASSVGFSPEFAAAVADPSRRIMVHHNHPRSSGFSVADIYQTTNQPGMTGLWAHGHNGTSYFAERGTVPISYEQIQSNLKRFERHFSTYLPPGFFASKQNVDDLNLLYYWAWGEVLQGQGYIKQRAEFANESEAAFNRIGPILRNLIMELI